MGQGGLCRVLHSFSNGEEGPTLGGGHTEVCFITRLHNSHTYMLLYYQLFHNKTDQKYLAIKNVP